MIDPIVRPAGSGDAAEVARLEGEARDALLAQRGGSRWLDTHPRHGGIPPVGGSVWVATIDEVVVGYLLIDLVDGIARIGDVFVHPGARELGFGDALLAAALDDARARGATILEAEALPGDRDTKNLYERAGVKARLITVSVDL